MNKYLKGALIGVGALVLSTVGIGASDLLQNVDGGLAGLLIKSEGPCAENAVPLILGSHAVCIDVYEASPSSLCPHTLASSDVHTRENLENSSCQPVSEPKKQPWGFVSMTEAQQLCARAGKRLPTNLEWYRSVSGSVDIQNCNIDSNKGVADLTGGADCVSPSGVSDLVGNVWEWVDGEVFDGQYNNRKLPPEGYVSMVDGDGVAAQTDSQPQAEYDEDYFWSNDSGLRGLIRGGYYGSGSDAGIYTLNAAVSPDFRTISVGFRCVQDLH